MPAGPDMECTFDLISPRRDPFWMRKACSGLNSLLKQATGLVELQGLYQEIRSTPRGHITDQILSALGIRLEVAGEGLKRIPRTGPLIVVANHPFGGVEAAGLASLLLSVPAGCKVFGQPYALQSAPSWTN